MQLITLLLPSVIMNSGEMCPLLDTPKGDGESQRKGNETSWNWCRKEAKACAKGQNTSISSIWIYGLALACTGYGNIFYILILYQSINLKSSFFNNTIFQNHLNLAMKLFCILPCIIYVVWKRNNYRSIYHTMGRCGTVKIFWLKCNDSAGGLMSALQVIL